jgi:glutamate dehydrogenase/leucine dehydrogenase
MMLNCAVTRPSHSFYFGLWQVIFLCVYLQLESFQEHKTIAGFPGAAAYNGPSLLEEECDVLCPCATENVITAENAPRIKARIIAEGANGPTTFDAHQILLERKVILQYLDIVLKLCSGSMLTFYSDD